MGEERYAKRNKTYGIATLRREHLRIDGDTMIFDYTGKWGRRQRKCVVDASLRRVVEECAALPGYEVFKYRDSSGKTKDVKSRDLNAYVKELMGPEFTPKDFRTWAETLIAAVTLAELGGADKRKQARKIVLQAVDAVTQRLGNTRDIARGFWTITWRAPW